MTKDNVVTSSSPCVVSVSSQSAVFVTLPTVTTTAGNGIQTVDVGLIKQENEEDRAETAVVSGILTSSPISTVRATHATLQSLLAAPVSAARVISHSDTIQVITLPATSDLITTSQPDGAGRVWQVIPSIGNPEIATIIAVADPSELLHATKSDLGEGIDLDIQEATGDLSVTTADGMAAILMPPPATPNSVLQNCPSWASRLQSCEKIGESYRGYVESEVQLDLLLTYHKQQTQSFWGTRQSPSPAKPSTRLMWKSQYVPFDGIPFVNIGSRAVVMECQYGPRRKGHAHKRCSDGTLINVYRQTCPARIYIKKVRKFPAYAVDLRHDKKLLRIAMDKAFHELRERQLDGWGQERYYVQLPTEKAHEFHEDVGGGSLDKREVISMEGEMVSGEDVEMEGVRLHTKVAQKIRALVSGGETRVYAIRRQLRAYVLRSLFAGTDTVPERHDLTLFPTVNDLKNHIHQALKDIENGTLPLTASTVNVEILAGEAGMTAADIEEGDERLSALLDRSITSLPMPETVTVTLTQNPDEDGHHIISRIETHLSDGTTQVSTTLTPETARLLSKLHPSLFQADSLMQLGALQPQNSTEESESVTSLPVTVDAGDTQTLTTDGTAVPVILDTGGEVDVTDVIDGAGEVMQIMNPDDACTQILPADNGEDVNDVSSQLSVPLEEEEGVIVAEDIGETDGKTADEVLGDTELITISMTDDNQLVLSAPGAEAFEAQCQ